MSIGNTQSYLDWAAMQEEDDQRDWQEMRYEMTRAERDEMEAWLDSLSGSWITDEQNENIGDDQ